MKIGIKIDPATGQRYMAVNAKGRALLLNPLTNKGTAFTHRERDELDLHGLVPPAVFTIKQQLERLRKLPRDGRLLRRQSVCAGDEQRRAPSHWTGK